MNNKLHRLCAISLLLNIMAIPSTASAQGEVNEFKVVNVRVDKDGLGYVKFNQPLEGTPAACTNSGHTRHLSFDLNSPGGSGILSLALAAQATNKSVIAKGTGTCDEYSVVESWNIGWVLNQ